MIVEVDAASAVPPYEQVRSQVAALVRSGALPAGSRLPAIRQLAGDLAVAPGTVARAYRELESEGLVETRGRHGTVVAAVAETTPRTPPKLLAAAHGLIAEARRAGLSLDDTVALVRLTAQEPS